jgi:hypothetical protein
LAVVGVVVAFLVLRLDRLAAAVRGPPPDLVFVPYRVALGGAAAGAARVGVMTAT